LYEREYPDEVALVPGAKQFIRKAEGMRVTMVFVSNRLKDHRKSTIKALHRLGINTENIDDRLFLKKKGGSSDKSARREIVAARYNVLLYFGDNLRDFSEAFTAPKLAKKDGIEGYTKAIQARLQQVDDAACHWGSDWFVLPNPVYGEWEKLLGNEPMLRLRPTKIRLPEAKKD
jgi:acid phosphatase